MTRYAIIATPDADAPIWTQVDVTPETARPSPDGSLRVVSWEGPDVPASLPADTVIYGRGEDGLPNIYDVLDGPEWSVLLEP